MIKHPQKKNSFGGFRGFITQHISYLKWKPQPNRLSINESTLTRMASHFQHISDQHDLLATKYSGHASKRWGNILFISRNIGKCNYWKIKEIVKIIKT